MKALGLDQVVLITDAVDENLALSSRNLPNVLVLEAGHADPVTLVSSKNVLVTRKAVAKLEELFA
jgi:large subunit ribosomal protein L4